MFSKEGREGEFPGKIREWVVRLDPKYVWKAYGEEDISINEPFRGIKFLLYKTDGIFIRFYILLVLTIMIQHFFVVATHS